MPLDKAGLIREIDAAIEALMPLSTYGKDDATALSYWPRILADNMVTILTAPANCLDEFPRRQVAIDSEDIFNVFLASLHRYFFANALLGVETVLIAICNQKGYEVTRMQKEQELAQSILSKCEASLSGKEKDLLKSYGKRPALFFDYFDTAINDETLPDKVARNYWRTYFEALSTIRNKVSHADTRVTKPQKDKIVELGIPVTFHHDDRIRADVNAYTPVLLEIERFLRSLQSVQ